MKKVKKTDAEKFHAKFVRVLKKWGKENQDDLVKEYESEIADCIEKTTGKAGGWLKIAVWDLAMKEKNNAVLLYLCITRLGNGDYSLK